MRAFFDESESEGYFTVGMYLFRKSKVRPFEKEWARMLKTANPPLPYFRMSACNAGKRPFDKMDRDERDRVAREAIRIVCKYAVYGHFVAVRPDRFYAILGKESFVDNPYTLCLYLCLMALRRWADANDPNALFAYFFEAGAEYQKDAEKFISAIGVRSEYPRAFDWKYAGHSFVLKEHSMPTQAADMLAWHSSKNLSRYDRGHKEVRGDFGALLDNVEHRLNYANDDVLRGIAAIVGEHAGSDLHLARHAFRNDMKAFRKDPEAVLRLLARQGLLDDIE
jgi:hypothetical protein